MKFRITLIVNDKGKRREIPAAVSPSGLDEYECPSHYELTRRLPNLLPLPEQLSVVGLEAIGHHVEVI